MATRSLTFRNLAADPGDPVESWPYEGLVTAIERGTVGDWVRITRAIDHDPWGEVARQVEDYLTYATPDGTTALLTRAVSRARTQAVEQERREVAEEIDTLVDASGLSVTALATRLGTSRTRVSTYRSGQVVPSAAMMVRLRRVVGSLVAARVEDEQVAGEPD